MPCTAIPPTRNIILSIYRLYWAEMVLNVILILTNITLLVKVDFVPLTPEEIERVEIEEMKHRMQIKEHQRSQRQTQAAQSIGQNDFIPQK